jgi:transposase
MIKPGIFSLYYKIMTNYREILRLKALEFSNVQIARSCECSRTTVIHTLKTAKEHNIAWPLGDMTNDALAEKLYPKAILPTKRRTPDFERIHKDLLKNGVNKRLLWTEYCEECVENGEKPLQYTQFCLYIREDEEKRHATMHINRKPAEQIEVDWAGDPAKLLDPLTGTVAKAYIFVGVLTYSQYTFAEAFLDEKLPTWITAHIHMYTFFGGVAKILVPDNCKTAVLHTGKYHEQKLNPVYREMSEHYGTAIIPARVRAPKDKASAEAAVRHISTWITAALRNEHFPTLIDLNQAIRKRLDEFNTRSFQKREGSRLRLYLDSEKPFLLPLPTHPFVLAQQKTAKVAFNYHVPLDGTWYSVPYQYIGQEVEVRYTHTAVEIFAKGGDRIAMHKRLYDGKEQYSTQVLHMPKAHQQYLEWDSDRFLEWARNVGASAGQVVQGILDAHPIPQQCFRSLMAILKMLEKHPKQRVEIVCQKALSYTSCPTYNSIKTLLALQKKAEAKRQEKPKQPSKNVGILRGADYYRKELS